MAPREENPNKSDDDLKKKKAFFKRIYPGFKKKATELSVLCGNSVGFICYGPDNDLHVWPEPQDNSQALPQIVAQFNALSDQKRKTNACDLYDFPDLKGLSGDELRSHLSNLDSHLLEIRRQKISIVKRNLKPKQDKETEEDDHLRVLDNNATISNCKVASSSEDRLGFGGVFDELGYVVRSSHETVSNLGSCDTFKVCKDVIGVSGMEANYSQLDPSQLGFSGGDEKLLGGDYLGLTYNLEVCSNYDDVWDFDFSSAPPPLLDDAWMVSGFDPLLGPAGSIIGSTYQTPATEIWGGPSSRL